MKKLIILLFIPVLFSCLSDNNLATYDKIDTKIFRYKDFDRKIIGTWNWNVIVNFIGNKKITMISVKDSFYKFNSDYTGECYNSLEDKKQNFKWQTLDGERLVCYYANGTSELYYVISFKLLEINLFNKNIKKNDLNISSVMFQLTQ